VRADGWSVLEDLTMPRHDDNWTISSSTYKANVSAVKQVISSAYGGLAAGEEMVAILIGHVTVPYSGYAAEDGHGDHRGAWPADLYYGDMDGTWTDATNYADTAQPLKNVINDGKWDSNDFPVNGQGVEELEVAIGRIDFAEMPAFRDAAYLMANFGLPPNATPEQIEITGIP